MGLLILISMILLVAANMIISKQQEDDDLKKRNAILRQTVDASLYEELELPSGINPPEYIKGLYELYDKKGMKTNYLLRIEADDKDGKKVFHLVFDEAGTTLTHARLYDETEFFPIELPDDFLKKIYDNRLPVMTDIDAERLQSAAAPPMDGLQDGIYRNEAVEPNRDDYTDYVEILVENGWIVQVKWDGLSDDSEKKSRAEASVSGDYDDYNSTENMWAQQAYFMEKELLEVQDPSQIAVKSDGTTEVVEGVTCEIVEFVNLAARCVQDSRAGKTYDSNLKSEDVDFTDSGEAGGEHPGEGVDPDGSQDAGDSSANSGETTKEDTNNDTDPAGKESDHSSSMSSGITLTPGLEEGVGGQIPGGMTNKNYSPGGEDGIIAESDEENGRIYGFFRDEMRSIIAGQKEDFEQQQRILLAVNRAYAFLQRYIEGN